MPIALGAGERNDFPCDGRGFSIDEVGRQNNNLARRAMNSAASKDKIAAVAQPVECVLGKDEVTGSIPVSSFVWITRDEVGDAYAESRTEVR